jgi:prepilin-type N-terminal cleavage/methylation domain-containing protein
MSKTIRKSGFTLIELLIVIGLLAALAAVLLPTLMGDREKALQGIDKYNAAGSLRTLRQYEAVTGGKLPNAFHTGLVDTSSSETLMSGISSTLSANVDNAGAVETLLSDEVAALSTIGITELAYGVGDPQGHDEEEIFGVVDVAVNLPVITVNMKQPTGNQYYWRDNDQKDLTFNGKGVHAFGHDGYSKIIALFIAPTVEWDAGDSTWVKGFDVGMDVPPRSPVLSDEFPYFIAYVGFRGGYEIDITVIGSATSGYNPGTAEHAHQWYATLSEAQTAALGLLEDGDGSESNNGQWSTSSPNWTTTADSSKSTTAIACSDGQSASITITLHSTEAKLLGVSTPNCTSMNP